ncbi:interleukin-6 receptor subunit beta [Solea solea]|uniref:interleukin-6 receptor subunit beta n=1 Tax=Solea solea TaxID=90069 RepID=UPI00272A3119|nr:interleukin-6 receptor subunit beta [Solea solea]XP_058472694.1 interleukin-6 receptor subunit beta [Solea solea]
MASVGFVQMLLLACFTSAVATAGNYNHLVTAPQPLVVEIGTDFNASCMVVVTDEVTADDLYWALSQKTVPKEQYTKINRTTLNVTVHISGEDKEWLYCRSRGVSPYVVLNEGKFMHAIYLRKAYPPKQPENVTCIALQDKKVISSTVKCNWDTVGRQSKDVATKYTLNFNVIAYSNQTVSTKENSALVNLSVFPHFMDVEFWVEAHNALGMVASEHLRKDAGCLVKTDPPADVKVISEKTFATSLLLNWSRPISKGYVTKLTYEIRFCQSGAHEWTYVPPGDIADDIESFRLQKLQPHKVYVSQIRCKTDKARCPYWSEWSTNATKRTPEDRPTSKPDLWKKVYEGVGERRVQIICKDPVFANGRITHFDVKVQEQKDKTWRGSSEGESFPVNRSDGDAAHRTITLVKEIYLEDQKSLRVSIAAVNSVGKSPLASLSIPDKAHELPPVEDLRAWPIDGQMWVEWKPHYSTRSDRVTEYVVQWVSGDVLDWQRENRSTRLTVIKDHLPKFVCYTVSVYPVYSGWTGKPASVQVFQEQGAPLQGPVVSLNNKPQRNEAELVWTEIPPDRRQGFITGYTIFYSSGRETLTVVVPPNVTTYKLTSLTGNTKYDVWVSASTVVNSTQGSRHSFTTTKYASGEIELIVVGVSLGFLFFVIMTMLLCIYKKDVIKRNFWPQIPNPGESTIRNWSPDYPLRAETPKENCMSGISVLDMDASDGKSVFEEDKAVLPLKKDKYLSEEHSSGIGGSSCMSSPRQSVSDSDEGGDMVDTTASTVQYSSVVASSGYKGQTPSSQAPSQAVFSRSESTQPLLDSEENPDVQDGSRQCFFRHAAGNQDNFNQLLEAEQPEELETLSFCPLEEDAAATEQTPTEEPSSERRHPSALSSYMPQLGGYRPQ